LRFISLSLRHTLSTPHDTKFARLEFGPAQAGLLCHRNFDFLRDRQPYLKFELDILTDIRNKTMKVQLASENVKQIRDGIRDKYKKVAVTPEGLFSYPTGRAGLEILGYGPMVLNSLPDKVSEHYCGVGNPFSLGTINEGEAVLDIGCGVGIDVIFAAKKVGASGNVVGVDIVSEMLDRGKNNIQMMDLQNVNLIEESAEKLSFSDESFDVVISNGVFNLIPNKESAVAEAFRLLKPGGRFMIADQVLIGKLEKDLKARIDTWFQ
jgi:2-polyprenyl-3-methyl-5-hydroxy-6-metoxy-1,4-benzoquinol methylase